MGTMKHLDLVSGIGGFALAAETVWPGIEHQFVEYNPFCQAVLKKHWPSSIIHGDIKSFNPDTECQGRQRTGNNAQGQHGQPNNTYENETPFILTGGFPCQPFSVNGKRAGTDDDRYLWPEMFRVIKLARPTWVIAENVYGIFTWKQGLVLETACSDLEAEGYEVRPFIIPACSKGAPHQRYRVWIIANAGPQRRNEGSNQSVRPEGQEPERKKHKHPDWERNWQEVAFATCNDQMDDGLSRWVDGLPYSRTSWRKEALKGQGNAIVPQVAIEIMRAIKES